jgi:phage baseplate assembly protein W
VTRALSFPFHPDDHGTAATSPYLDWVREQIEQILLTIPGERVNRPDFGCGIQLLIFDTTSAQTVAATEYVVRTALRRHLADVLTVDGVRVSADDSQLNVEVLYTVRATGDELATLVSHPLEPAR